MMSFPLHLYSSHVCCFVCRSSKLDCESVSGCEFCVFNRSNGTTVTQCNDVGLCPKTTPPATTGEGSTDGGDGNAWRIVSGVFIAAFVLGLLVIITLSLCVILRRHCKENHAEVCLATSEHSILDSKAVHAHNAVMEMGSLSSTSTSKGSIPLKTPRDEPPPTVTDDSPKDKPLGGNVDEQDDHFSGIPESLQMRGGFHEHDIFKTGHGSLNPSHAGGIWF